MDKIRYRLVYNRKKKLNRQGTALVQVEASLNQRKVYFKTNLYLKPEHWDCNCAQVCSHPQSNELNAMLFEFLLKLQSIELEYWKRGISVTLSLIKESVCKNKEPNVSFINFAANYTKSSDRKDTTKNNILTTITLLKEFRSGLSFKDITYSF